MRWDGDLAFFLASQDCAVDAVDWAPTNYNGMAGVRAMRESLNAPVHIEEIDLNGAFRLPRPFYSVIFFMGALYHLKNPLTVLEQLANSCAYCVLTTRVTRYDSGRRMEIGSLPVAYLVDRDETNHDSTNYFLFTPAGLRRALSRADWHIAAMMARGATSSDPVTADGDERAYCFLRSAHWQIEHLRGVHPREEGDWNWTERRFTLRVWHAPAGSGAFRLPLFVPEDSIARLGEMTLRASIHGEPLPPLVLTKPGCQYLPVPARLLAELPAILEIELDKCFPPDGADRRERGIVLPLSGC